MIEEGEVEIMREMAREIKRTNYMDERKEKDTEGD